MLDILIRGGEVVTPYGCGDYDVGITGEKVVAVRSESTRLNSSHALISYAVFCLKKKTNKYYCPILGTTL